MAPLWHTATVAVLVLMVVGVNPVPHHREKRVIGGTEFENGKWPWLVSLQGKIPELTFFGFTLTHRKFYCGASLINNRWLMTAAHCFTENDLGSIAQTPEYWHARLGDIDIEWTIADSFMGLVGDFFDIDEYKNWFVHAERIVIHPNYQQDSLWYNDIALVRLDQDIPSSAEDIPQIQSVLLPESGNMTFPTDGQMCIMKGWGCTTGGGPVSTTAHEVALPKVPESECRRYWGVAGTTRLCAGRNLGQMGICSGDSGGPLVCQNEREEWIQVGIASFTSANRPGDVPGVFTRVSEHIDWINDVISEVIVEDLRSDVITEDVITEG